MRFIKWNLLFIFAAVFFTLLNIFIRYDSSNYDFTVIRQETEGLPFSRDRLKKKENSTGASFTQLSEHDSRKESRERLGSRVSFEQMKERVERLENTLQELKQRQSRVETNIKDVYALSSDVELKRVKTQVEKRTEAKSDISKDDQTRENDDDKTAIQAHQYNKDEKVIKTSRDERRTCSVTKDDRFPRCRWMYENLQSDRYDARCHGDKFAVNKSDPCSILKYLSEVEPWCPPIHTKTNTAPTQSKPMAEARTDIEGLMKLLRIKEWAWIRMRAKSFWNEWVESYRNLETKQNMRGRQRKRIFLFMGAFIANKFFFEDAFKGGPLGELVQWTDVICSLYILGHDLVISSSLEELRQGKFLTLHDYGCAVKDVKGRDFDFIISDVTGSYILEMELGPTYWHYTCKQLLLDSFGTDPEFNYDLYKEAIPGGRSGWANRNVHQQQLMTMYPHSPDNLFMGFAVPQSARKERPTKKKAQALVYGKQSVYYRDKRQYLDTLHKHFEIHANIAGTEEDLRRNEVPDYIINHGIVNGSTLVKIIQESKVFIGLGFPFEGPAPLDAIANGCFYINPKLIPYQSRENAAFFRDKPTFRKLTSQNPYAEEFIGRPFVYTIDMNNETEVEKTIQEILATKEIPHLPYEFSLEGMLQRINYFMKNLVLNVFVSITIPVEPPYNGPSSPYLLKI